MGLDERSRGSLPVSSPHEASGSLGEGSAPPHPPTPGASFEESSVARMETSSAGAAMEASSQSPSPPRAVGTSSSVAAGCRAPSENSPFGGSARAPAVLGALPSSPLPGAAAAAPATDLPDLASACPPYGSKSIIGRRSKMEDACIAIPALVRLPLDRGLPDEILPPRIASHLRSALGAEDAGHGRSASGSEVGRGGAGGGGAASRARSSPEASLELRTASGSAASTSRGGGSPAGPRRRGAGCPPAGVDTLHFFGVFDGHGGADAAVHCAQVLHLHVRALLEALADPEAGAEAGFEGLESGPGVGASASSMDASGLLAAEALAAEALAGGAPPRCSSGAPLSLAALLPRASSEAVEAALTRAFYAADEEFGRLGGYEHLALVGTTAVVALVGSRALYVANCGDSRAVLCRGGVALPLTDDHKAAREDETARVEAAGGQILFWNGVRVMGLLAVSRAVGDHSLRPYVIAQPEVTIVARHEADELLVLASDGLWDVMSNQEACTLAKKCLQRARARGSSRQSAARVAATVLTRAAVDRGSRDNVTVVIVDMTPGAAVDEDLAARAASGLVGLPPGEVAPLAGGAASPVASAPSLETRPLEGQRVESKGAAPLSPFDSVAREPPVRRVEMAVPPLGSPFSSGVLVPES